MWTQLYGKWLHGDAFFALRRGWHDKADAEELEKQGSPWCLSLHPPLKRPKLSRRGTGGDGTAWGPDASLVTLWAVQLCSPQHPHDPSERPKVKPPQMWALGLQPAPVGPLA